MTPLLHLWTVVAMKTTHAPCSHACMKGNPLSYNPILCLTANCTITVYKIELDC